MSETVLSYLYNKYTRDELISICKEEKIKNHSNKSKTELIALISQKSNYFAEDIENFKNSVNSSSLNLQS
jgi:hypothetical protein